MTKRNVILLSVMLSFMLLFVAVGYAALTDSLHITGNVEVEGKPFEGIYISDIQIAYTSGSISIGSYDKIHPTTVSTVINSSNRGSVTFKITVHNNTNITYWYLGQRIDREVGNNIQIGSSGGVTVTTKDHSSDSSQTFNTDDWVPPQTYRDFYVTYSFGSSATSKTTNLINFHFGMKMDAVHDKFLAVLNDNITNFGYDYLADAFNDNYADNRSAVIDNVGEYKYVFDQLFGPNMTINVDGVETPVTVMVVRENVDGKTTGDAFSPSGASGCEYTVYITVDPLNSASGKAEVYAVSYTKTSSGQWIQLGQLYKGEANRVSGGVFDPYNWLATKNTYYMGDNIAYDAGHPQGSGDQYDQYKTIEQLMSANDQDIYNGIDNANIMKKVYDIVKANSPDAPGMNVVIAAYEKAVPYFNNMNNGQEFKIKRTYTRAELDSVIIGLQNALDYYSQVK